MNTATDLPRLPLAALHLSPLNARKTRTQPVDGLAASIAAHGLLQNLTVTLNNKPGEYEVVAGGRRLAAMQLLQREGRLPAALIAGVPCLVIEDNNVAHEASTAENTLREAMHPADQFEAFKRMVDQGKSVADVAAHFGIGENVVRQRMKLANLNPQFIEMYREGGIDLDQLQALALTDDHEEQRKAWFGVKYSHERTARELRARITKAEVGPEHALAKFVGLDAYEAAGGPIRRDLFTDAVYFGDVALLEKLALDSLELHAQQDRDAGWSWVDVHLALDHSGLAEYPRSGIEPTYTPPDKATKKRIAEIEAKVQQLVQEQDSLPDDAAEERYDEIDDELFDLQGEARRLEAGAPVWPDSAKQKTGVVMWVDRHDGLKIVRGLLRPGQRADKSGEISGTPKPAPGSKAEQKAKKPEIGATLLRELSAHRSEAARFAVARDPQLALALQIDWLLGALDYGRDSELLRMRQEPARRAVDIAKDVSKALQTTEDLPSVVAAKKVPKAGRLAWLIKQPQAELLAMFAYLVATRFDGIEDSDKGHAGVAALHEVIGFDMAQHWTPACDGFLERLPKALILLIVEEAGLRKSGNKHSAKAWVDHAAGQKGKEAVVAYAAKVIAGSGWLPKTLRGPGYDKPAAKAAPAKKSAAKKAPPAKKKTAATKKPAAKKAPGANKKRVAS